MIDANFAGLLCGLTFAFGALVGLLVGVWLVRPVDRPAVTPWGESTALWADHDWDWWYRCGRHSDPRWAGAQRHTFPEVDPSQIGQPFTRYHGGKPVDPWYVEQGDRNDARV
jgi:hypothetical protein